GKDQDLRGIISRRGQGQTRQTRAVVNLPLEESIVGSRKRHQNDFEVDAFVFVKTSMVGGVNRQEADARRRNAEPDFLQRRLRVDIGMRQRHCACKNPESEKESEVTVKHDHSSFPGQRLTSSSVRAYELLSHGCRISSVSHGGPVRNAGAKD